MATVDPYASYDTYTGVGASQATATALIGPPMAGWLFHVLLFGVVASHAFDYVHSDLFKADSRRTKLVLATVVLLDLVATLTNFAQALLYGTQQKRDTNTLLLGVSPLDSLPFLIGGLVALTVQLALAERASNFFFARPGLRWTFLGVVGTLAFVSWIASAALGFLYALFSANPTNPIVQSPYIFNIVTCVWVLVSASVDIIITLSLIFVLKSEMRGFNLDTDSLMMQIMRLGTETGAMTAATALVGALLAVSFPRDDIKSINICLAFTLPLPSLYALSYLITLSTRGAKLASRRSSGSAKRTSAGFTSADIKVPSGVWITKEAVVEVDVEDGIPLCETRRDGRNVRVKSKAEHGDESKAPTPKAFRVTFEEESLPDRYEEGVI